MERELFRIREGMVVLSADGEKLGRVTGVFDDRIEIEKGIIFHSDREARLADVAEVRDNDVYLRCNESEVETLGPLESRAVAAKARARAAEPVASTAEPAASFAAPLVEEEAVVEKRLADAGEVVGRKETSSEERQAEVPEPREVVRLAEVPASGDTTATPAAVQEETIAVFPVRREVVEISKRAVVREELIVSKELREGTETIATTVRREEIDIVTEGDLAEREVVARGEPPFRKAG
ncbi:Hypothetical protein A7982_11350 [Minicystis rosea]|nr:Hypothetical protein A7982_11350 [Minicystis rosea]